MHRHHPRALACLTDGDVCGVGGGHLQSSGHRPKGLGGLIELDWDVTLFFPTPSVAEWEVPGSTEATGERFLTQLHAYL